MTAAIIFSKNRAMQLEALLRSIGEYAQCFSVIHILYHAEADHKRSYEILREEYRPVAPVTSWHEERDFNTDLRALVNSVEEQQICFLVDDDLFYRHVASIQELGKLGYSFRLGHNITRSYNSTESDFDYLFSLDGHIYWTTQVQKWFASVGPFRNPNELEAMVNQITGSAWGGDLAYFKYSSLVNIPHNVVTNAWTNRNAGGSAAELKKLYLDGWRIDIPGTFKGVTVNAPHMEIPYYFQKGRGTRVIATAVSPENVRIRPDGPLFSICHPTARLPMGWHPAFESARQNADNPQAVEYIVCIDRVDAPSWQPGADLDYATGTGRSDAFSFKVVVNDDRRNSVDAYNHALKQSTGAIVINAQDDVMFPPHWDTELLKAIGHKNPLTDEFFIHVSSGSPSDDRLFAPQIYSRARYLKQGYAFSQSYESMYADNELTERAYHDGVVIEARHLLFEQLHPAFGKGEWDEVYARENDPARYVKGREVIERRRREFGFGPQDLPSPRTKHIAICLPGETFTRFWVKQWTEILLRLAGRYSGTPIFNYCTNVYVTRHQFLIDMEGLTLDYVLWIDDDNLVTADQVEMLIADLECNPKLDGVAGWCYAAFDPPMMSCGNLDPKGFLQPFTEERLEAHQSDLVPVEFTGFPVFLTKADVYRKLGKFPFRAVLSDWFPRGQSGEDTSFCIWARDGKTLVSVDGNERWIVGKGLKFAVDRRVKVPHMKTGDLNGPKKPANPPPLDSTSYGYGYGYLDTLKSYVRGFRKPSRRNEVRLCSKQDDARQAIKDHVFRQECRSCTECPVIGSEKGES